MLVSAIIAVGFLFDPNDYKDQLSNLIEEQTGRSFIIEDDLELTFFPWLGIQASNVHLGNTEGFGVQPFASVARLIARVRLFPLIQKRVEIDTIELAGLELNLARNQAGITNWESFIPQAQSDIPETEQETNSNPLIQSLNIAGLSIRDGIVFWRENLDEVKYIISELELETGSITTNEPISVSLDFQLVSVSPAFSVIVNAHSVTSVDINSQNYEANNVEFEFVLEDGQHDERATGLAQGNVEFSGQSNLIQISSAQLEADLTNPPLGPNQLVIDANTERVSFNLERQILDIGLLNTTIGGIVTNWEISPLNLTDTPMLIGEARIDDAPLQNAFNFFEVSLESDSEIGNFDFYTNFTLEMGTKYLALENVRGTALGISFEGALSTAEGEISGAVNTDSFNPTTITNLFSNEVLEQVHFSELKNLTLDTEFFIGTNQVLSIRNFNAAIPGASVNGALDRLENGARLRGRIQTSDIDAGILPAIFPLLIPGILGSDALGIVNVNTTFDYRSETDSLQLEDLSAGAFGLQVEGSLSMQNFSNIPETTGNLRIQEFSPRDLFERLGKELPSTSDSSALTSATINTNVTINSDNGFFKNIRMQLDDTSVTGNLTVEDFELPTYSFNLTLDKLNLDRYLAPTENNEAISSNQNTNEDLLLPENALDQVRVNGQISVSDLTAIGLSFSNISTSLLIENGVGRINSANADFYGGQLDGDVELDSRAGASLLSINGSGVSIDLASMTADLSGETSISGSGTLELELSGEGESLKESLSSATGFIDVAVREGAIYGFNLNHSLCDNFNRLRNYPRPEPTQDPFTEFILLRGNNLVNDGIATTNELVATTPNLQITAEGGMDLASKNLNYDVDAEMTEAISISQCNTLDGAVGNSIPLKLSGTTSEPIILPDFGEILLREAQDVIRDAIMERLLGN
ncbi:MAG: hypothetical protein CMM56_02435 [Rhodospirillaceae bacterium]|nr:hypothetical protein [Rhodospirillaceae bacterium]